MVVGIIEKAAYNKKIMQSLLDEDGVKENVDRMTEWELGLYKEHLMKSGLYGNYAMQYQKKQVAAAVDDFKKPAGRKRHKSKRT